MTKFVEYLAPGIVLSLPGLEAALGLYEEKASGVRASVLMVPLCWADYAYQLLADTDIPRLLVVPVPGLCDDIFIVSGSDGLVYSWC